jgi:hypothetical protein
MQDLPNYAAEPMSNGPNGRLIAQPRQQTPEHRLKVTAFLSRCSVRRLVQYPPQSSRDFVIRKIKRAFASTIATSLRSVWRAHARHCAALRLTQQRRQVNRVVGVVWRLFRRRAVLVREFLGRAEYLVEKFCPHARNAIDRRRREHLLEVAGDSAMSRSAVRTHPLAVTPKRFRHGASAACESNRPSQQIPKAVLHGT